MAESSNYALEQSPSGKTVPWQNPDSGHAGSITPTKTYQDGSGKYCREYTQTVKIGNKEEKAYGTACRQEDGHWQIVK